MTDLSTVSKSRRGDSLAVCNYCGSALEESQDRCAHCGAEASDRYLWALVSKLGLLRAGSYVLHYRPKAVVARRFAAVLGTYYHPCGPGGFDADDYPIQPYTFDPAKDAGQLSSSFYGLILANEGLESLGESFPDALTNFGQALQPGGSLIFGGGFVDSPSILGPKPSAGALAALLRRTLGSDCRVKGSERISRPDLQSIGVARTDVDRLTPRTLFWYQS